jgi:uroporphyrinogen-III synthase
MRLLVTRPGADAERTADTLRSRGHAPIPVPLLTIEFCSPAELAPGPFAAVVMTSANAARAIAAQARCAELVKLPLFAVGAHTAEVARQVGFSTVTSADGGWPDLARLIAERLAGSPQPRLYLAAEQRAGDIAGALAAHGLVVETVVVYRAVANPNLAQDLRAAFADGLDGVLHYSRRSAQAFLTAARAAGRLEAALACTHHCLSSEVAAPLRGAGAVRVEVAPRPDEAALIELLSFA